MIYITGDTHGKFKNIYAFCIEHNTTVDGIMIILGDTGINYTCDENDTNLKGHIAKKLPITLFCIHGNHEIRPETIPSYETIEFHGGKVFIEPEFPNIIFAKDGEVYDFDGNKCIVAGGAYSIDKYYRLIHGHRWFADEQPSDEIKQTVENKLEELNYNIDIVLTHTCPLKYEPTEAFFDFVEQSRVDKSTEEWLDKIEDKLNYKKWYCGHYHTEKNIDKVEFLYKSIIQL